MSRCVWLTGLCGAGKTTLAWALKRQWDGLKTTVLDGDDVRRWLSPDLGYSYDDRLENVRRVATLANSYLDEGTWVIAALVTPYAAARELARQTIGPHRFTLVHVDTPLALCRQRKHELYARADSGEIPMFTGVSDIFEPVDDPDAMIADGTEVADVVATGLAALLARNLMPPVGMD